MNIKGIVIIQKTINDAETVQELYYDYVGFPDGLGEYLQNRFNGLTTMLGFEREQILSHPCYMADYITAGCIGFEPDPIYANTVYLYTIDLDKLQICCDYLFNRCSEHKIIYNAGFWELWDNVKKSINDEYRTIPGPILQLFLDATFKKTQQSSEEVQEHNMD